MTSSPDRYGVIGWPLDHTLSPAIHNPLFRKHGIKAEYTALPVPPEEFGPRVVNHLRTELAGFNVTLPYKREIIRHLDACDPVAAGIGAVNTVVNRRGTLVGHNTDEPGFFEALRTSFRGFSMEGRKVLLLGAGGAAFAVAWACLTRGCASLVIANRTPSHAKELKKGLSATGHGRLVTVVPLRFHILRDLPERLRPDLVVNATSYGLKGEGRSLVSLAHAAPETLVMDLVYNPSPTALLAEAKRHGLRHADGLAMLVHQALIAFELWTGIRPEAGPVLRRLRKTVGRRR